MSMCAIPTVGSSGRGGTSRQSGGITQYQRQENARVARLHRSSTPGLLELYLRMDIETARCRRAFLAYLKHLAGRFPSPAERWRYEHAVSRGQLADPAWTMRRDAYLEGVSTGEAIWRVLEHRRHPLPLPPVELSLEGNHVRFRLADGERVGECHGNWIPLEIEE